MVSCENVIGSTMVAFLNKGSGRTWVVGVPTLSTEVKPDYVHTLSYNPSLDGIRAVAVLSVVFAHFGVVPFRDGIHGVDVFFVLSGYLISRVVLRSSRFSMGVFYWYRLVRLAPALMCLCSAYLVFGWFLLDRSQVIGDVATSLTYIANWTRAFGSGFPQYLGQTWSLSIQEQFYLVAPVLLVVMKRNFDDRTSIVLIFCAALTCIIHRTIALHSGMSFDRAYNGLDTHCDGLLCGAALGSMEIKGLLSTRRFIIRGQAISLCVIIVMFCIAQWNAMTSLIIDIATMWLIAAVNMDRTSATSRLLAFPPLVKIGQFSYSLYLWHYPIFLYLFYHLKLPHMQQICIGIPLSFAMAILSYHYVERPVLRIRDKPKLMTQCRIGLINVFASVLLMFGGLSIYLRDEISDVFNPKTFRIEAYGPQSSVKGEGFNVQPNGDSVIWVKTSAELPRGGVAEWHSRDLQFSSSSRSLNLVAPAELINNVGRNVITIKARGVVVASLELDITDRADTSSALNGSEDAVSRGGTRGSGK